MKAAPAILMLIALTIASFAMFGVASMGHGGSHTGWCPVAVPVGDCPTATNALASVNLHLDGLRGFLTTTAADASVTSLLTLLAIIAFLFARNQSALDPEPARTFPLFRRAAREPLSRRSTRLIRWLAFHEQSPAFA